MLLWVVPSTDSVIVSFTTGGGSTGGITGLSFLQEENTSEEMSNAANNDRIFILNPEIIFSLKF